MDMKDHMDVSNQENVAPVYFYFQLSVSVSVTYFRLRLSVDGGVFWMLFRDELVFKTCIRS